ncbi:hypothetical protein ACW0TN_04535 [Fusobacterium pseudoperiodonticum]|jgi:hypothetical protein|uniref:Uncharacterized protein n=3 Tax=Fusobacterium TaxID=848 RepID=A0AAD0HUF5_9FUSO|nr:MULTISPECIES: hypothetical protein [Fusobacterium]ATV34896.1 hypothetical protein CTM64_01880 [Fusobacterium pseudoperiodonticum]ATV62210.1 hypothetical protein CTM74_10445 [Fusobacterium pseudoperiodonticum]AVQ25209.1 hypothetical protein C4N17_05555 [Fusobacterium periodonticum]KGE63665.1 hypothetical protein FSAG_000267 [Fusobacterium periodonticum 2_1_31]
MRSKIIKILLFLFIGLECLAITNREKIEKDLKRLNITDPTMIAQTILIDEKMGSDRLSREEKEIYLEDLKKLADENPKNFYLSYPIARYYLDFEDDIEEVKKNRKYFDNYVDNVFQDEEKYLLNISYYRKIGDKEKAKKYYDDFMKKYANKWSGKIKLAGEYETDQEKVKKYVKEAFELLKKDIKNGNKDEVTDEEFFIAQIAYEQMMIQEILEKKEYQKAVDYYLDNIANKDYYTQSVLNMNGRKLAFQLHLIIQINEKHLNKNKENIKKIRDSKVYKELEKMGEIIKKI